eukprot:TRINITY_DN3963_c0_g2_i1.p1 TRINITY_DN3963_c0_g2~~TRINITY_DN3963_c0_g2_i1.p1  ORF type:complete len:804 (-),score=198.35 TRINITY_DN3963_c0_g2_i1:292-2703(-)
MVEETKPVEQLNGAVKTEGAVSELATPEPKILEDSAAGAIPAEVEDGEDEEVPKSLRKRAKRLEVFLGGLSKDTSEADIKVVLEAVGPVTQVRLFRDAAGQSKGYAFARYATLEGVRKASKELEFATIKGRKVGILPNEGDDTLFIGNINKAWNKENVVTTLEKYAVEGIEEVSLVRDANTQGQNRGFAFVEFISNKEALTAWKQLQEPNVLFGTEKPAKVSWATPSMPAGGEPDEETMALVKCLYVDGMPPHWEEERVKEHFGTSGVIEKVVLSKNMPSARRKDFGFITYTERADALKVIEAHNNTDITDGEEKFHVTVSLAKPPKKSLKAKRGPRTAEGQLAKEDSNDNPALALLRILRDQTLREEAAARKPGKVAGGAGPSTEETKKLLATALQSPPAAGKGKAKVGTPTKPGGPSVTVTTIVGEKKEKEKSTAQFACEGCGFGFELEKDLKRHTKTKVHRMIANLRKDEKYITKMPVSILNEFTSRRKAEVAYESKTEGNLGPFEFVAKVTGGTPRIPQVTGVGKARQKKEAKHSAAFDALEQLMKTFGEAEFIKPGQGKMKGGTPFGSPPLVAGPGRGRGSPFGADGMGGRGGRGGRGGGRGSSFGGQQIFPGSPQVLMAGGGGPGPRFAESFQRIQTPQGAFMQAQPHMVLQQGGVAFDDGGLGGGVKRSFTQVGNDAVFFDQRAFQRPRMDDGVPQQVMMVPQQGQMSVPLVWGEQQHAPQQFAFTGGAQQMDGGSYGAGLEGMGDFGALAQGGGGGQGPSEMYQTGAPAFFSSVQPQGGMPAQFQPAGYQPGGYM